MFTSYHSANILQGLVITWGPGEALEIQSGNTENSCPQGTGGEGGETESSRAVMWAVREVCPGAVGT